MRLLLEFLVAVIVAQISHSHPVGPFETSSPTGPDFMEAVVQYTKSQAESTTAMVHNVLLYMPKTEEYEVHREYLRKLLQHAENMKKPGNCHTKMHKFSQYMGEVFISYMPSDASVEHKAVLKLMEENGLKDMMVEADTFLKNVTLGQLGIPVEAGSLAFTVFLTKDC